MNKLAIHTPEGVRFDLHLAGPATRFLAWFMDALVIYGAAGVCQRGLSYLQFLNKDVVQAAFVILLFVVTIGYPMTLEWMWRGQTVGKRIFGLRVMDAGGRRLSFGQIALRNLLRFVDVLPLLYLVGGAALVLSRRGQRLGEMVADTVVVRQKKLVLPVIPPSPDAARFNSLLEYPHLAARLRQSVSAGLAQVAMEAVVRRDELGAEARIEVFQALGKKFRECVKFPEEALAGLSEERFVRDCLEVVLRGTKVGLRGGGRGA